MKKRNLFLTLGLSLTLGVGVAAGLAQNVGVKEVKADDGWGHAYIKGSWDGDWSAKELEFNSQNDRYELTINLPAGTTFKFTSKADWSGVNVARHWKGLDETTQNLTNDVGGDDHNFELKYSGDYTFVVDKWVVNGNHNNPGYGTHVFAPDTYFVAEGNASANREFTKIHLWNSTDTDHPFTPWDNDPTLASLGGGQAYNIRFGANNYGLYKIPNYYLANYDRAILRDSGQTADLNISAVIGAGFANLASSPATFEATTSDNFKAAAIAYEAVSHRGGATYELVNLNFSICATSYDDALAIVNSFDSASSSVKAVLANVNCEVYDVSTTVSESTKKFLSISEIVDGLRIVVAKKASSSMSLPTVVNKENTPIIIIVAISLAVLTVGSFFVIRKRREQE